MDLCCKPGFVRVVLRRRVHGCGRVRIPGKDVKGWRWVDTEPRFLFSALSLPAPYSGKCRKLWAAGLAAWSGPAPRPKSATSPVGAAQVIHYERGTCLRPDPIKSLLKEESTQGTYVEFQTFFDTYTVQPNGQECVHRRVVQYNFILVYWTRPMPVCTVQKAINNIQYNIKLGNSIFKYWTDNIDAKWNYITHHHFGRPTDQVKNRIVILSIPNQTCSTLTIRISNFGTEVWNRMVSSTSGLASMTEQQPVTSPFLYGIDEPTWDSIIYANLCLEFYRQ
ncbi:uncharacterized protein B0T23DRAFT_402796 [Neurospora hispaniola]|uniref:Uncharacterized protein n=1 Tax=Neurospora hispaniola TaxID=588809 RepID=A0AAJ0IDT7_9PEZI|nr:hypothetical protein B0T23DRAFT_402796 [Neurospora hispaniola]